MNLESWSEEELLLSRTYLARKLVDAAPRRRRPFLKWTLMSREQKKAHWIEKSALRETRPWCGECRDFH
jgi:hypothetical protein